jgi:leucyl aminopeptidase (aminopeptidase T)
MKGARIAVNECMKIKPNENVIIITDREMPEDLSRALMRAVIEAGGKCQIKMMEPLKVNGQEPPHEIAELMKKPDALFLVTSRSLSHTKARREASKVGVRIASMPKVTEFSFIKGGLTADYKKVNILCKKIKKVLKGNKQIQITSKNGTNVTLSVERRKWKDDKGLIHKAGHWGNLPAGEVATAPIEGSANGIIVFDHMAEYGKKVKLTVEKGIAKKIEGSRKLEKILKQLGEKSRVIAEIGIGCNPKAKITENILEAEKSLGTVHFAIGNNIEYGGNNDIPFHKDGIIKYPTIIVDSRTIMKNGKMLV